jgi:hypothetical protein
MTLILFIILFIAVSFIFYRKQNSGKSLGGKMALSKLFWLDYTLICWFFLPIYFGGNQKMGGVYFIWYTLSLSMWIRGLVEIFMLYKTKNWTPPIGISHDLITIALILWAFTQTSINTYFELFMALSLLLGLVLETYYAWAFYSIMKGKTQGEDALWFATKEDPRFRQILLVTTIGNYLLYTILFSWLWRLSESL